MPNLAVAAPTAFVAPKGVSPTLAAEERKPVQEKARSMRMSGQSEAAGDYLSEEAIRLRDPVLFLDAADAYKAAGEETREIPIVEEGMEQARVANDILQFLDDDRASKKWKPVSDDHRGALLSRADTLIAECEILIDEIRAEQAAPAEEPVEEEKQRGTKPGQIMIIAGAGLAGIGVAGLGLGAAGLGIGASAQSNVNDPTVYGQEFDEFDTKGKRGNLLAYVGFPIAAVGLGAGVALIVLGLKKKKAAGGTSEDSFARSIRVAPSGPGMVLTGRF